MFGIVHGLVIFGIGFILISMFVIAIASWFGMSGRFAFLRFLERVVEPFRAPVRRIVPPAAMLDLSFFVTFFLLQILQILLLQGLPAGW